jgi:hypothetical protein
MAVRTAEARTMGDKTEQPTEVWRPPGGGYLEGEDAEGHRIIKKSPAGVADEPGPEEVKRRMVAEDDEDDTEGHQGRR